MNEIWKDIKNFEGLYQISNLGRVKALKKEWLSHHNAILTHEEKILKPFVNKNGYLRVALSKKNRYYKFAVHRLVANAFICEPPNKNYVVNHKDFDRKNNNVNNLEWLTYKENSNYSSKNASKSALNRLKPKSGHHYISERKLKNHSVWVVSIKKKCCYKQFETLKEALNYRNSILTFGGIK